MTPACTVSILNHQIRLYRHPTVPHGMLWSAMVDVAGLVGYPPDTALVVADTWRQHWPGYSGVTEDGAVAVPSSVVYAFMGWLGTIGLETAPGFSAAYEAEAGRAYLALTAHLSREKWREALNLSSLADTLPDPEARPN